MYEIHSINSHVTWNLVPGPLSLYKQSYSSTAVLKNRIIYLPPASEGWGKVIIWHASVCLFTCWRGYPHHVLTGGTPSFLTRGIPPSFLTGGYPILPDGGTPCQAPRSGWGGGGRYPQPEQHSVYLLRGGMPLAFNQKDLLVKSGPIPMPAKTVCLHARTLQKTCLTEPLHCEAIRLFYVHIQTIC